MEIGLFTSSNIFNVVRLDRHKASPHEVVVFHYDPALPNPRRNEADAARYRRPQRIKMPLLRLKDLCGNK